VRRAASRQRKRGHAEEQHEQNREAPLPEQAHQAPDGLVAVAGKPAFQLVAQSPARLAGLSPAPGGR